MLHETSYAVISMRQKQSSNIRSGALDVKVFVNTTHVLHKVDAEFLSFAIDSSYFLSDKTRRHIFNTSSTKLRTLISGLSPAILRIGGTKADFMFFDIPPEPLLLAKLSGKPYLMYKEDVANLVELTRATGSRLLLDLNLEKRF